MAKKKSYGLSAACCCRKGIRNYNNEDNFYFYGEMLPELNHGLSGTIDGYSELIDYPVIFGVFDGMGGEEDGQTASAICAQTCREMIGEWRYHRDESMEEFMRRIVMEANKRVFEARSVRIEDMGSSFAALLFYDESVTICNIGQGRIFAADRRDIIDVSVDHSEEMNKETKKRKWFRRKKNNEEESLLPSQYIGMDPDGRSLDPFIKTYTLSPHLRLMICSDGITEVVPEEELAYDLTKLRDDIDCAETVIDDALDFEVEDDATVIVVSLQKPGPRKVRKAAPFSSSLFGSKENAEGEEGENDGSETEEAYEDAGYDRSNAYEEDSYGEDGAYAEEAYEDAGYDEPEAYNEDSYGEDGDYAGEAYEDAVYGESEAYDEDSYGEDGDYAEEAYEDAGYDESEAYDEDAYGEDEAFDEEYRAEAPEDGSEETVEKSSGRAAAIKNDVVTKISGLFAGRFKSRSRKGKETADAADMEEASQDYSYDEIFADEEGDSEKAFQEVLGMGSHEEYAEEAEFAEESVEFGSPSAEDMTDGHPYDSPEDLPAEENEPDYAETADSADAPDAVEEEFDDVDFAGPAGSIDEEAVTGTEEAPESDMIESFLKDMDSSDE